MARWGNDTTYALRRSQDTPTAGWTKVTEAQYDAADLIPQQYRKGSWPASVVEMTQPEKDAVDAALATDEVDGITDEILDLLNGHIRAERQRINDLRADITSILAGAGNGWPAFKTALAAMTPPIQITPTANRAFIRTKVEDIQGGTPE